MQPTHRSDISSPERIHRLGPRLPEVWAIWIPRNLLETYAIVDSDSGPESRITIDPLIEGHSTDPWPYPVSTLPRSIHISPIPQEKPPPSFWGFEKKGGAFPETAKIFRFWFAFTVGNALKCFGNECFPLKNSNFESCFWKKSRLRRAHFEFPPLPTIPGGLKTAQFRSVPVCFSIDAFIGFCILK